MNEQARIQKLEEVKQSSESKTTLRMRYRGAIKELPVYEIPIEYLIFNQYNGRIGTIVKTYEYQNGRIDESPKQREELIFKFLEKAHETRNKNTLNDLRRNTQLHPGIVTKDGVIIDGNRRFMLINKLFQEGHVNPAYFRAAILEDCLHDNPKEIRKLETTLQLGADQPTDYNPIEKYLQCNQLSKVDKFSEKEIAEMMGEKPSDIKKYLLTFELMEEYLEAYEYKGMYTRLEKCEGPLLDLRNYLDNHKKGNSKKDWDPEEDDIDDLKHICFDYIRAGYLAHGGIRDIARSTGKDGSFFNNKNVWVKFDEMHKDIAKISDNETSLDDLRKKRPKEDVENIIESRDIDWKKQVDSYMKRNLGIARSKLGDIQEANSPLNLLQRAINTLKTIKIDTINDVDSETAISIKTNSHDIRKLAEKFIKIIEKRKQ